MKTQNMNKEQQKAKFEAMLADLTDEEKHLVLLKIQEIMSRRNNNNIAQRKV